MIVRRRKIFFLRRTVYTALYVAPDYFIELVRRCFCGIFMIFVCSDLKNNFAATAGAKKGALHGGDGVI